MRKLRVEAGLNLGQLSKLMNTSLSQVSAWERGEDVPSDEELSSLAGHLGCTPEDVRASLPSKEQAEERKTKMEQFMTALVAAKADAKAKGLGRGSGGRSKLPCPACQCGELHYSVAVVNGHMWGKCSTTGCVSWME